MCSRSGTEVGKWLFLKKSPALSPPNLRFADRVNRPSKKGPAGPFSAQNGANLVYDPLQGGADGVSGPAVTSAQQCRINY